MSNTTPNLGLFKYDTTTDANVAFSITNALNNNWDIIDTESNLKANKTEVLNKSQITNGILEAPNGVVTYSGSTITVKAGLKVLIPNGRNADGTLNNIGVTLNTDITETNTYTYDNYSTYLAYENNEFNVFTSSILYYDEKTNYYKNSNTQAIRYVVKIGQGVSRNNGTVTSFNSILQPIYLLKRSDSSEISGLGMPSSKYINLTLGASGSTYTAPNNGWVRITAVSINANFAYVQLNARVSTRCPVMATGAYVVVFIPVSKGEDYSIEYTNVKNTQLRFYYAEGEV